MDTWSGATGLQRDILAFWFGEPGSDQWGRSRKEWFKRDPAFDREIATRFGVEIERALDGAHASWGATAHGALARVLLLDQFTRNIFRDTARAFAGDPQALATARAAVEQGLDRALAPLERAFLYLPFEHAESREEQVRSLELFGRLAAEEGLVDLLEWAQRHSAIVERFGRYPHRNAVLGRASTAEELEFLKQPGSSF